MTGTGATDPAELVRRWDAQQAAYIAEREGRFTALLDALALSVDGPFTVVDLACGPGSLTQRLLERFPQATVIAVDLDPVLLSLARLTVDDPRATLLDLDLLDADWPDAVRAAAGGPIHAMVSTTALHWFGPDHLVGLYGQIHDALAPGGIFLNGDHFRFSPHAGAVHDWAARHDAATQERSFAAGADEWDAWWSAATAHPQLGMHAEERERRFADRPAPPPTDLPFQLALLGQAGFAEHGTVWQLFDDYVVYGLRGSGD